MTVQAPESHRVRSAAEIAVAARAVQLAIRARLLKDVTALWPALDKNRLDETFPGWIRGMGLLVRSYHGQSSEAAGVAYRSAREQATQSPAPRSLVKIAPVPAPEWLDRAFGYSGPGMLQRDVVKPNSALTSTLGTASRIVLDGGRATTIDTVKADPVAKAYYRLTDGDPCAFCGLMASRGPIYKSADTAGVDADKRFTGNGAAKFHNDCGCSIVPWFGGVFTLSPAAKEAARVYENRGSGDAMKAFRKAWNERNRSA